MAFEEKTDYFGKASGNLVIQSSDENKSAQVAQARNEKADIVKQEVYAELMNPTCNYILKGDYELSSLQFGETISYGDEKKLAITSIAISTSAGAPPTISISGEEVKSTATNDCFATIGSTTLKMCHHAQPGLWSCPTITGTGCYVTAANYTASVTLTKATKNGETEAFDITDAQIQATYTIVCTGTTAPSIEGTTEWVVTSPLSKSDPDADYPTYSVTLTKALSHDETT